MRVDTGAYIEANKSSLSTDDCNLLTSNQTLAMKNVLLGYEAIGIAAAEQAVAAAWGGRVDRASKDDWSRVARLKKIGELRRTEGGAGHVFGREEFPRKSQQLRRRIHGCGLRSPYAVRDSLMFVSLWRRARDRVCGRPDWNERWISRSRTYIVRPMS
jgi:hypothetical protein